ncbi:MAG: Rieske (2Fe-2S) protein [Candidatus Omnitrophica bacterium]|nr:Rieske (2Fe-2S) protein [Candidatus Omnitrophota bacterium]
MMKIVIEKEIPYPFDVVLSQYFDYEHISHVHPNTVGEYRLLDSGDGFIRYEHLWPKRWNGQKKSIVRHSYQPPNEMWFTFEEGYVAGTVVHSVLHDRGDNTLIHETYEVPVPDWKLLRPLIRHWTVKSVERIWKEDLDVEVCREGWPGVPECMRRDSPQVSSTRSSPGSKHSVGLTEDFPDGALKRVEIDGREILVYNQEGEFLAVSNRCPHTGGPLHLGEVSGLEVTCPWHGAKFDLRTGSCLCGPSKEGLTRFAIGCQNGRLFLDPSAAST